MSALDPYTVTVPLNVVADGNPSVGLSIMLTDECLGWFLNRGLAAQAWGWFISEADDGSLVAVFRFDDLNDATLFRLQWG